MSLKSKYESVNKALGIGATKPRPAPVMSTTPAHETAIDKALRTTREALDTAEMAVQDANKQTLAAAKRAMKIAEQHYSVAFRAHEKTRS